MTNPMFDMTTLFNSYRQSLAPVAKAQQEALKILETFARFQLSLAGDYIDFSVSQAKAIAEVKSPSDFVTQQSDLTTRAGGHDWTYFNHALPRTFAFLRAGLETQARRLL